MVEDKDGNSSNLNASEVNTGTTTTPRSADATPRSADADVTPRTVNEPLPICDETPASAPAAVSDTELEGGKCNNEGEFNFQELSKGNQRLLCEHLQNAEEKCSAEFVAGLIKHYLSCDEVARGDLPKMGGESQNIKLFFQKRAGRIPRFSSIQNQLASRAGALIIGGVSSLRITESFVNDISGGLNIKVSEIIQEFPVFKEYFRTVDGSTLYRIWLGVLYVWSILCALWKLVFYTFIAFLQRFNGGISFISGTILLSASLMGIWLYECLQDTQSRESARDERAKEEAKELETCIGNDDEEKIRNMPIETLKAKIPLNPPDEVVNDIFARKDAYEIAPHVASAWEWRPHRVVDNATYWTTMLLGFGSNIYILQFFFAIIVACVSHIPLQVALSVFWLTLYFFLAYKRVQVMFSTRPLELLHYKPAMILDFGVWFLLSDTGRKITGFNEEMLLCKCRVEKMELLARLGGLGEDQKGEAREMTVADAGTKKKIYVPDTYALLMAYHPEIFHLPTRGDDHANTHSQPTSGKKRSWKDCCATWKKEGNTDAFSVPFLDAVRALFRFGGAPSNT